MAVQKGVLVSALALFVVGCAQQPTQPITSAKQKIEATLKCNARVAPEERVELEIVDTMVSRDQQYAALAQLQKEQQTNQEYWLRYAQLLAQVGRLDQSEQLYEQMRQQCDSAEAYHGLGVVNLKQGHLMMATKYLQEGVHRNPSSSKIRNDYGYALLLEHRFDAAKVHLRTALELENGKGTARQNLAVAYLMSDDAKGLEHLLNVYLFDEDEMAFAKELERQLRSEL